MDPLGASDNIADAPSTFEERRSNRVRKPSWQLKRNMEQNGADAALPPPKRPRKSRRATPSQSLPSPISSQIAASSSQQSIPLILEPASESQGLNSQEEEKQAFEASFAACKNKAQLQALLLHLYPGESYEHDRLFIPERACEVDLEELAEAEHSTPDNPLPLFRLFFPLLISQTIASNTNINAKLQEDMNTSRQPRKWEPITARDIEKTVGALYMIGAVKQPGELASYWSLLPESPIHRWTEEIPLVRFQQIIRYLKINNPEQQLPLENWWMKLEPLATHWRITARRLVKLGSKVTVDEQLLKFSGRSRDITEIASKAAGTGYKIYTLTAKNGYIADFLFYSVKEGTAEIQYFQSTSQYWANKKKEFTNSERIVLTLVDIMRKRHPGRYIYAITLDNFFTTHHLLSELKEWTIGCYGTCKTGAGVPKELLLLKDCTSKERDYGLETNTVFQGINCCFIVDMKGVCFMTTVHDVKNDRCEWRPAYKRPKAAQSRALIDEATGDVYLKYIRVSKDYNDSMGGSDQAQQLMNYYTTSCHPHLRTWWPIFFAILDATVSNMMRIFQLRGQWTNRHSHLVLQKTIALQLLHSPNSVLRKHRTSLQIWGQQPTQIAKVPGEHEPIRIGKKRGWCEMCKPQSNRGRPRRILGDITNTLHQEETRYRGTKSMYCCKQCSVKKQAKLWLCRPVCWNSWHSIHD